MSEINNNNGGPDKNVGGGEERGKSNPMTPGDASRIQAAEAKSGSTDGFASRARSAATNNVNSGTVPGGDQGQGEAQGGSEPLL